MHYKNIPLTRTVTEQMPVPHFIGAGCLILKQRYQKHLDQKLSTYGL